MRLVNAAFNLSSRIDRFADFAVAHAWLLDKEAVFEFYSRPHVMSDAARKGWVEPDCKALPAQLTACGPARTRRRSMLGG